MTKGDCERICPRFRLRNEELNLFSTFGSCPWAGVGFAMQKPGDLWQHFPQSPGSFCPLEQKVGPLQNSHFATVPFICGWRDSNRARAKREKHAGGMFRCPRACRRGARAGRISPSPPDHQRLLLEGKPFSISCFPCPSRTAGRAPRPANAPARSASIPPSAGSGDRPCARSARRAQAP